MAALAATGSGAAVAYAVRGGVHAAVAADPAHALDVQDPEREVREVDVDGGGRDACEVAVRAAASVAAAARSARPARVTRAAASGSGGLWRWVITRLARASAARLRPCSARWERTQHRRAVVERTVGDQRRPGIAVGGERREASRRSSRQRACVPPRRGSGAGPPTVAVSGGGVDGAPSTTPWSGAAPAVSLMPASQADGRPWRSASAAPSGAGIRDSVRGVPRRARTTLRRPRRRPRVAAWPRSGRACVCERGLR